MKNSRGSVGKILLLVISVLVLIGIVYYVVDTSSFTTKNTSDSDSELSTRTDDITDVSGSAHGEDLLAKKAILDNDITICERIKITGINVIGLTKEDATSFCKKQFALAMPDKNNSIVSTKDWKLGTMSYTTPDSWMPHVDYRNTACFGGGCPIFMKTYSDWGDDDYFLYFNFIRSNATLQDAHNYISDTFPSISSIETIAGSSTEIFVIGDIKKMSDFIFIKEGNLFDIQYRYSPVVYSQFDKERVINMINSLRPVSKVKEPSSGWTTI